jgi:signal transduction histidine kinase
MLSLRKVFDRRAPASGYGEGLELQLATVRMVLAVLNFVVILVDHSVPAAETNVAVWRAMGGATLFFLYAAATNLALRKNILSPSSFKLLTPFLDVFFSGILIALTDGYLSPFNLWLVFAVVASGVTDWRWQPYAVTLAALLAHVLIALIPQRMPIDIGTFAVRTSYLVGFAAVVAGIGSTLARGSDRIRRIEEFGYLLAQATSVPEVLSAVKDLLSRALRPGRLEVVLDGQSHLLIGGQDESRHTIEHRLAGGSSTMSLIRVGRSERLTEADGHFLGIISDRVVASIRRIKLAEELVEAAAREERLRFADEVHDSYLQIMAAVSMHAEVATGLAASNPGQVVEHLEQILNASREGARKAREFVDGQYASHPKSGPEHIRHLLTERWHGPLEVKIDESVHLSEGQWHAIEAMAKEGVNNAVMHGHAQRLSFSIAHRDGETTVELADDGAPPPDQVRSGYGLTRLRKIVEPNHGTLSLCKNELGGTSLVLAFAVAHD